MHIVNFLLCFVFWCRKCRIEFCLRGCVADLFYLRFYFQQIAKYFFELIDCLCVTCASLLGAFTGKFSYASVMQNLLQNCSHNCLLFPVQLIYGRSWNMSSGLWCFSKSLDSNCFVHMSHHVSQCWKNGEEILKILQMG